MNERSDKATLRCDKCGSTFYGELPTGGCQCEPSEPSGLSAFTKDDVRLWEAYDLDYFVEVLNGDYDLDEARNDLRSLIKAKR